MLGLSLSGMFKKILKSMFVFGAVLLVYFTLSLALVFWPNSLPFETIHNISSESKLGSISPDTKNGFRFITRDGESLFVKKVGESSHTQIIFLHGIASTHKTVLKTAKLLNSKTGSQVLLPDLRGHGESGGTAFDVAYKGQYEDDLEDLILHLNERGNYNKPRGQSQLDRKILIGGHSMGGGIAMRYALKEHKPDVDGYLLFAPNFGEGPTQKKVGGNESHNAPIHFDTKRMIGILMLNSIGVTQLDSLPIMYFNFPPQMMAYSYASIMSAQPIRPDNTEMALASIKQPLLTIVGSEDEVFVASAYPDFIEQNTVLGETVLVDETDHMGVLYSEDAIDSAARWFNKLF